jgi:hypothetical protein
MLNEKSCQVESSEGLAVQANIKVYNIVWRVSPADSRMNEKGDSPVHEAPALRGVPGRVRHSWGLRSLSQQICKRLFPRHPWPPGHKTTALPLRQGSPSNNKWERNWLNANVEIWGTSMCSAHTGGTRSDSKRPVPRNRPNCGTSARFLDLLYRLAVLN